MVGLGLGLGYGVGAPIKPVLGASFLTSVPDYITCTRSSEASYRGANGLYHKSLANTARIHYSKNGESNGLAVEVSRQRKNNYIYPESGAVSNHFTDGAADISVVTNANTPLSDDYTNHDQVWRINNASGSPVTYKLAGTSGNTTVKNIRCWHQVISGTGAAIIQIGGRHSIYTGKAYLNSRTGAEVTALHIVPSASGDQLEIVVPAGMVIDVTLCEMQDDNTISGRNIAHLTTPILHGAGTQASRTIELLSINDLDNKGFLDGKGTIVVHGTSRGSEQTNACFLSLYQEAAPTTQYTYFRQSPNGDTLVFGKNGTTTTINGTFPIQSKRRPTPLDMAIAYSWDEDAGHNFWSTGTYNINSEEVVPTGIDRITFYRHDVATRDEQSSYIRKFELYNVALDDATLKAKSRRSYGHAEVTVSQSNVDIENRGIPITLGNNSLTTKAAASGIINVFYPNHGLDTVGMTATIAGATTTDGITAAQINTANVVTVIVDADNFEITTAGTASSGSVSGGGTNMNCVFYINGDAGGGDYIAGAFMEDYVADYMIIRGPDYYDGVTDSDYGGGALLVSSEVEGIGSFVDDTDPENLVDGTDLAKILNTLRVNHGVTSVNNFKIDLGPYENSRTVEEINTIVKQGIQYLVNRLTSIGGFGCKITFQMWSKRFNTDDIITWTWREMLRDIVAENDNVIIVAEPYNLDLDPESNAHFNTEVGYIKMYLQNQRRILKDMGIVDFGNVDSPMIASATFTDASADIVMDFTTEHGAEITSGDTAILAQLFRVLVNDVEATVSSAAVSGTEVTLTLSAALETGDTVTIDYPYRLMDYDQDAADENDAGTAVLVDTSCWVNPVAQFSNYIVVEA